MTLYKAPSNKIIYDGEEYDFFPYWNRVLIISEEVIPSKSLSEEEKARIIVESVSNAPFKLGVYETILHELFPKRKRTNKKPDFSFSQDADLIYSGFLQTYGINLYDEINKMDWRIFLALLRGLPESTEFSRIIKLRKQPIPKASKYNQQYINLLIEAKMSVALKEPEEDAKRRLADAWRNVARGLISRCQTAKSNTK